MGPWWRQSSRRSDSTIHDLHAGGAGVLCATVLQPVGKKATHVEKTILESRALLRLRHDRERLPELFRGEVEVELRPATNSRAT